VKDKNGRQVAGVGRLVGFTVVALLLGVLFVVWGVSRGRGLGLVEIMLAVVIAAALLVLWGAVAVTQWKRRSLQSRD
jgi:high-affinity Fe2+/Pb2+ permease